MSKCFQRGNGKAKEELYVNQNPRNTFLESLRVSLEVVEENTKNQEKVQIKEGKKDGPSIED